ncbi:hypothetical protein GGI23_005948, partial [Coemansia sp. RSA 2559]
MHRLLAFVAGSLVGGGAIYALVKSDHKTAPVSARTPIQPPLHVQQQQQPPPLMRRQQPPPDNTGNEFLAYGDPGPVSDFLLRSRYAASYNRALRNPNW